MTPLKTWEPLEPGTVLRVVEGYHVAGQVGGTLLVLVTDMPATGSPFIKVLNPSTGRVVDVWEPHARNALELAD